MDQNTGCQWLIHGNNPHGTQHQNNQALSDWMYDSGNMTHVITEWQLTNYDLRPKLRVIHCELSLSDSVTHIIRRTYMWYIYRIVNTPVYSVKNIQYMWVHTHSSTREWYCVPGQYSTQFHIQQNHGFFYLIQASVQYQVWNTSLGFPYLNRNWEYKFDTQAAHDAKSNSFKNIPTAE